MGVEQAVELLEGMRQAGLIVNTNDKEFDVASSSRVAFFFPAHLNGFICTGKNSLLMLRI